MLFKARSIFALTALAATLGGVSQTAEAQAKPAGFSVGYTDIGPVLGLGNIGNAGMAFGGRFERAIKALPEMNNGTLGINASFDWYSWSSAFYSYSYIPIGVTANYHFKLTDTRIDPFIGAGLGYQIISCDYDGPGGGVDLCNNSALYFIGRVGARYFFKPNMAAYVDAGAGAATLSLGLMFKLQ
jgi:hypothetical protein